MYKPRVQRNSYSISPQDKWEITCTQILSIFDVNICFTFCVEQYVFLMIFTVIQKKIISKMKIEKYLAQ